MLMIVSPPIAFSNLSSARMTSFRIKLSLLLRFETMLHRRFLLCGFMSFPQASANLPMKLKA